MGAEAAEGKEADAQGGGEAGKQAETGGEAGEEAGRTLSHRRA